MTDDGPGPEGRPLGRRAFLVMVGAGLTSLAWGGSALDVASKSTLVLLLSTLLLPDGGTARIFGHDVVKVVVVPGKLVNFVVR